MTSTAPEGTGTAPAENEPTNEPQEQKPTETVDFWKQKAREQEKRAKENSSAAQRLKEIEDAQKSEAEKAQSRISELEAEIPTVRAQAFRDAAVSFGGVSREDADLFLTGTDQETLVKQAERLGARLVEQKKNGNRVPNEGKPTPTGATEEEQSRAFAKSLFSGGA